MRNSKLVSLFVVCLFLAIGASALAQPPGGRGGRQGNMGRGQQGMTERNHPPALPDSAQIVEMVNDLASEIDLSDKQEVQLTELYLAHFAEAQEMMNSGQGRNESNRESMESMREEFENDVKELLTEEQQDAFDEYQKNHRPNSRQQRGNRNAPPSRN